MDIKFKLFADKAVNNLKNRGVKTKDLRTKFLELVRVQMNSNIIKQFESEGAFGGSGWQKLADSTIKARRSGKNKSAGDKILQDTGILKGKGVIARKNDNSVAVGFSSYGIYGKYHQTGGKNGRPPKREIIVVNDDVEKQILKLGTRLVKNWNEGKYDK